MRLPGVGSRKACWSGLRAVTLSPGITTTDPDEFLRTEADVVVEALGGGKLASRLAAKTIEAGRTHPASVNVAE
jgi:hypothetical protein